jgi:hypothetical protein
MIPALQSPSKQSNLKIVNPPVLGVSASVVCNNGRFLFNPIKNSKKI